MIVAVLDACVLYPPSLRDLLLWLASVRVYSPRWTEQIHDEWTQSVLADHLELTAAQLDRTRRLMNQVTPECLVSGYESHIPTLSLPDVNDRHVLAAAIKAQAALIVTFNLADFPIAILRAYGIQAVHPDVFLCALFDEKPELFLRGLKAHRASLQRPPKTAEEYVATLQANGLRWLPIRVVAPLPAIAAERVGVRVCGGLMSLRIVDGRTQNASVTPYLLRQAPFQVKRVEPVCRCRVTCPHPIRPEVVDCCEAPAAVHLAHRLATVISATKRNVKRFLFQSQSTLS